jgi:hypothetical protein
MAWGALFSRDVKVIEVFVPFPLEYFSLSVKRNSSILGSSALG